MNPMQTPKRHPSFKTLICKAIRNINPNNRVYITPKKIMYYIYRCNYEINFNRKLSKFFFRRAFMELVDAKILEKGPNNHSYRITPKLKLSQIKLHQLHNLPSLQESSKKIRKYTSRRGGATRRVRGTRGGSRSRGSPRIKRGGATGRGRSTSVSARGSKRGTTTRRGRGRTAGTAQKRTKNKANETKPAKKSAVRRTGASNRSATAQKSSGKKDRAGTKRSITLSRRTKNPSIPPVGKSIKKKPGPSPRSARLGGRAASHLSARGQRGKSARGGSVRGRRGRNTSPSVLPPNALPLFLTAPTVQQPSIAVSLSSAPNKEEERSSAVWQYYDQNNVSVVIQNASGWYDYDKPASDIVEEEWQKYIKNRAMCDVRAVKSGAYEYAVDFMSWTQTNITHHNHKVRRVRRLDENGNVTLNPYQN